ncbi:MAG: TonB-dependent receptor [Bacteroidales bacterium]
MKQLVSFVICMFISFIAVSQTKYTIRGYVTNRSTGEILVGASIYENKQYTGVITNDYGFYSLSLPAGTHTITYSYIGYDIQDREIKLTKDTVQHISLVEKATVLDSVVITPQLETTVLRHNDFSKQTVTMNHLQHMPVMFGEPDLIKYIQLQSGVKTLGEGSSGMFVRGGSSDQNLILIDEAPVYNPSHLFGLVSVFNPAVCNNVELYKSNMPAQYGGRVSSVVDCKMKEGNMHEYDFSVGVTPFSGNFMFHGPLKHDTASFLIAGRKSIVDFFARPGPNMPLVPGFYDVNMKVHTKISNSDRLFLSLYTGHDVLEATDGLNNSWGNTTSTLRWNRNVGSKFFINTSCIISNYSNHVSFHDDARNYNWVTGLRDIHVKSNVSYYVQPQNVIKAGVSSIYHSFIPGETDNAAQSIPRIQAFEHAVYASHDVTLNNNIGFHYGLRLSAFQNHGKATWYTYNEQHEPTDIHTNKSGVYNTYVNPEPRVSIHFMYSSQSSVKLAYARNVQYMQILQNNTHSYSSLEMWFPAHKNIPPITADVFSAGWFYSLSPTYSVSAEIYYKKYQHQLDYVNQARLLHNPYIVGEIRSGTAHAYGAECNIHKKIGNITGNISYTYSKAIRKIADINNNEYYNSPYDIPHDFKISGQYTINESWRISAAWMYMSGQPATFPVGFYTYQHATVPIYTERNASRLPDYHRLDVSCHYFPEQRHKRINWRMNVGLFNVYARKNPLGYEFISRDSAELPAVYQYTLFRFLPTFSITAEF